MMQLSLFDSLQDNFIEAQRRLNEARKHYNGTKKLRDDNCEHTSTRRKQVLDDLCITSLFTGYNIEAYCKICGKLVHVEKEYI